MCLFIHIYMSIYKSGRKFSKVVTVIIWVVEEEKLVLKNSLDPSKIP